MFIYILKSPSNGWYIGQTNDFNRRMIDHKYDSKHLDTPLYRSIRKYGWENFEKKSIIELPEDMIDWAETMLIKTTRLFFKCYNLDSGGNLNKTRSPLTRQKLSKINKGKKLSEETKKKISIAQSGKFGSSNNNAKAVEQIDLKTGATIKTFGCITEASNQVRIDKSSIVKVCKGKAKTAGGFIWRYA